MDTVHLLNWHAPHKTACNLKLTKRNGPQQLTSQRPTTLQTRELTCERCVLRLLRTGQKHGLVAKNIVNWDLKALRDLDLREGQKE